MSQGVLDGLRAIPDAIGSRDFGIRRLFRFSTADASSESASEPDSEFQRMQALNERLKTTRAQAQQNDINKLHPATKQFWKAELLNYWIDGATERLNDFEFDVEESSEWGSDSNHGEAQLDGDLDEDDGGQHGTVPTNPETASPQTEYPAESSHHGQAWIDDEELQSRREDRYRAGEVVTIDLRSSSVAPMIGENAKRVAPQFVAIIDDLVARFPNIKRVGHKFGLDPAETEVKPVQSIKQKLDSVSTRVHDALRARIEIPEKDFINTALLIINHLWDMDLVEEPAPMPMYREPAPVVAEPSSLGSAPRTPRRVGVETGKIAGQRRVLKRRSSSKHNIGSPPQDSWRSIDDEMAAPLWRHDGLQPGLHLIEIRNKFLEVDTIYKGLHLYVVMNESYRTATSYGEIQLHTEGSRAGAEIMHAAYKQTQTLIDTIRANDFPPTEEHFGEYVRLQEKRRICSANIEIPDGFQSIYNWSRDRWTRGGTDIPVPLPPTALVKRSPSHAQAMQIPEGFPARLLPPIEQEMGDPALEDMALEGERPALVDDPGDRARAAQAGSQPHD